MSDNNNVVYFLRCVLVLYALCLFGSVKRKLIMPPITFTYSLAYRRVILLSTFMHNIEKILTTRMWRLIAIELTSSEDSSLLSIIIPAPIRPQQTRNYRSGAHIT
jgi:hypothetical protein